MLDCLADGVIDTLKLLPYLLATFLILEIIEHNFSKKSRAILAKNRKVGPVVGGLLGAFPQCGFSVMAANLFSNRIITTGTLVAIFLSTSDEMLPIMVGEKLNVGSILGIVGVKTAIGIMVGVAVDLICKRKNDAGEDKIGELCEKEHCDCERRGIFLSSVVQTLKIGSFVLFANLLINFAIFYVGTENLSAIFLGKNLFTYFLASLVGLIPNCAGSVIITEMFLSGMIAVGTMFAGLLTSSGLGLLLLFKTNKNIKENVGILLTVYFSGVFIGAIVDWLFV